MNVIHDSIVMRPNWQELYAIKKALEVAIARFDHPDGYHECLKVWKTLLGDIHL